MRRTHTKKTQKSENRKSSTFLSPPLSRVLRVLPPYKSNAGVATVNEISSCLRANGAEETEEKRRGGGDGSDDASCSPSFPPSYPSPSSPRASALASTALAAAALVGALAALLLWSGPGAAALASTGARRSLLPLARSYLVVRAAGVPLALVSGVAQAALLAQRDARSPARAVALQVAANVLGDWLLVSRLRLGLPGAALATVAAQAAGCAALLSCLASGRSRARPSLRALRGAFREGGDGGDEEELEERGEGSGLSPASPPPASPPPASPPPASPSPLPSPAAALAATAGPVTLTYLAKTASYWSIQSGATRLPSVAATAAHQPLWSAWTLLSFAHTPLEAGALAFVPPAAAEGERERVATLRVVAEAAAVVGVLTSAAAAVIALSPSLLTPDLALHPLLKSLAPQAAIATAFCAADVAASGCLVARRRLSPLVRSMAAAAVVTLAASRFFESRNFGLGGVWWSLVAFFAARAVGSCGALWRAGEFRVKLGGGGVREVK